MTDDATRTVFDVGRAAGRHVVVAALIGGGLGGMAVVYGVLGLIDGQGVGAIALIIGLLLLAFPVLAVVNARVAFRPRRLVFEPSGLRWEDLRGTSWFVPWHELGSVLIHGRLMRRGLREAFVVLHLYPADPRFAAGHPEMAKLRRPDGDRDVYWLPLISSDDYVPRLDKAMKRYAPTVYRGVALRAGHMDVPVASHYPQVRAAVD